MCSVPKDANPALGISRGRILRQIKDGPLRLRQRRALAMTTQIVHNEPHQVLA